MSRRFHSPLRFNVFKKFQHIWCKQFANSILISSNQTKAFGKSRIRGELDRSMNNSVANLAQEILLSERKRRKVDLLRETCDSVCMPAAPAADNMVKETHAKSLS